MEAQQRIPAEFVYHPPAMGAGPVEFEYRRPPPMPMEEDVKVPTPMRDEDPQPEVNVSSWSQSGPWAQKRVHVTVPPSEKYQVYGRVPPQSWTDMAKEWFSSLTGPQQEKRVIVEQPERFVTEAPPQFVRQEQRVIMSQPERFVIDAPPQPVYERVVYLPAPVEPHSQQFVAVPTPRQVVTVPAPQPILIPIESEIVCRGHPSDRTELCFGYTIPPRQLKYDIIREETSGCFGFCRGQRFKAVCRKCRAVMPPCQQCGKQSVIRHP